MSSPSLRLHRSVRRLERAVAATINARTKSPAEQRLVLSQLKKARENYNKTRRLVDELLAKALEREGKPEKSALSKQECGDHYKKFEIQPVIYIHKNGLGFLEGAVIKYVSRWKDKGGIADLKKAIHCLQLLIELEEKREL